MLDSPKKDLKNWNDKFLKNKTKYDASLPKYGLVVVVIEGTQQSGILNFRIAELGRDGAILQTAREIAARILDDDPMFMRPEHVTIRFYMETLGKNVKGWSRIS